ncbi:Zinc finger, C2H2 [Artemisia annua]|uniref:Zinc finger, C2H2 n=1 Tax=Artemisia annua TaxID=35608 RepID=A0A2U1MLC3_ARTAN|nr:Zinc finger, C2H2 [Artemisia annua]
MVSIVDFVSQSLGLWRYPSAQSATMNRDNMMNTLPLVSSNDALRARIPMSSGFMYGSKPSVQVEVQDRFATNTSPPYYHNINTSTLTNHYHRFYGGNTSYTSHQTPITGSSLGLERYPSP